MSIHPACDHCGGMLLAADTAADSRIWCSGCQGSLDAPLLTRQAVSSAARSKGNQSRLKVIAATALIFSAVAAGCSRSGQEPASDVAGASTTTTTTSRPVAPTTTVPVAAAPTTTLPLAKPSRAFSEVLADCDQKLRANDLAGAALAAEEALAAASTPREQGIALGRLENSQWRDRKHGLAGDTALRAANLQEADSVKGPILLRAANFYLLDNQFEKARQTHEAILAMQRVDRPTIINAILGIGITHEKEQSFDKARETYARILTLPAAGNANQEKFTCQHAVARSYMKQKRWADCVAQVEQGLAGAGVTDSQKDSYYRLLLELNDAQGNIEAATVACDKLIANGNKTDEEKASILIQTAGICERHGAKDKAIAVHKQVLAMGSKAGRWEKQSKAAIERLEK